jgi:hypothetical protein
LDLFKVYDKFDNDMENLIKIVLNLGYVDDIEESENLKADFTSQIKKIYAQVGDNQEFVSSLNEIEDEVMKRQKKLQNLQKNARLNLARLRVA